MSKPYKEPGWKIVIDRIGTAILMNSFFMLCCLPIVTIGSAWCGLYGAVGAYNIGEYWFPAFKEAFRQKFLSTTVIWTLCLLIGGYMLVNTAAIAYYRADGFLLPLIGSGVMTTFALMFIAAILPLRTFCPTDTAQWAKNGVNLVLQAPLQCLATAVLMWLPIGLIPVFFYFGVVSLLLIMTFYYAMAAMVSFMLLKKPILTTKEEGV